MNPNRFAAVTGLADDPAKNTFTVYAGPGASFPFIFSVPKGTRNLPVLDVETDHRGDNTNGKVHQWFELEFPNGEEGWVRDDVLSIVGDFRDFGYGFLFAEQAAFSLTREGSALPPAPAAPSAPAPAPRPPSAASEVSAPAAPSAATEVTPPTAPSAATEVTPPSTPAPATEGVLQKVTEEVMVGTSVMSGTCFVTVTSAGAVNFRSSPDVIDTNILTKVQPGTRSAVLEVKDAQKSGLHWVRLSINGQEGWLRDDNLTYEGDCAGLLGVPPGLFPAPMKTYIFSRGYTGFAVQGKHNGVDYAARRGEPVYSAPAAGLVILSFNCNNCRDEAPSTVSQGIELGNRDVFFDPNWGNGYGHYVIVRYLHADLPASTKEYLASVGRSGHHMFVMYAHLHRRHVQTGQEIAPHTQIGECGDTGNSKGDHVHLEIRSSAKDKVGRWAELPEESSVLDPLIMFSR